MATKTITPRKNSFNVTGIIVCRDAFINPSQTVAHFRIAGCSSGKDTPSCFFDCVQFAKEDNPINPSLLKKGTKVEITGYFHMNVGRAKEGSETPEPKMELVVNSVKENTPVEVEVPDEQDQDLPAGPVEAVPESLYNDLLKDLPEEL